VREDSNTITLEAELSAHEKDVAITTANGTLISNGKKQEEEANNKKYYLAERSYGSFGRSLRLPDTIDDAKVEAKFDKGVLKIAAAKKPEAVRARKIEIN
jgi:HSP20 family protein